MNPAAIAAVFAQLDPEIWLVTARAGDRRGGLIATFVCQASIVLELPRVVVGIARHHYTWELVEASGAFGLHLLGEEQLEWVWRFGLESGRDFDKLAGLATHTAATGSPLLTDALAWLDCRVEARFDTGDRTLYLAEVADGQRVGSAPPLTLKRLRQLAPPGRLCELGEQIKQDSIRDAEAIRRWRQHPPTHPAP
ncbi:MAG TPA: flavin reductase family protein [Gemmataceae bacterium]|jgi:flavin reductase (DIM6/NTAB) family NADH-FMN oxidoreductase RutF|nr:flavin reductase family protein [Gemmataceae bacterium]